MCSGGDLLASYSIPSKGVEPRPLFASALPHENLPLSASSISFPQILHWSHPQDCPFVHQLWIRSRTRQALERKKKILHEADRRVPKTIAFYERGNGGSPAVLSPHTGSARPLCDVRWHHVIQCHRLALARGEFHGECSQGKTGPAQWTNRYHMAIAKEHPSQHRECSRKTRASDAEDCQACRSKSHPPQRCFRVSWQAKYIGKPLALTHIHFPGPF